MKLGGAVPLPTIRPAYVWDRDSQSWFLWLFKIDKNGDRVFNKLTFTPEPINAP